MYKAVIVNVMWDYLSALGKMRQLLHFLESKKQRLKLPRKYRPELSPIPELAEMSLSVEPNTSLTDEESESELDKLIKKDKSMKAPGKCPICDKVFDNFEVYMTHVWPLQFEEGSRKVIIWLEQTPESAAMFYRSWPINPVPGTGGFFDKL